MITKLGALAGREEESSRPRTRRALSLFGCTCVCVRGGLIRAWEGLIAWYLGMLLMLDVGCVEFA